MNYAVVHTPVSELERQTEEQYLDRYFPNMEMRKNTFEFAEALRAAMPGIKFRTRISPNEVYVYREGDATAMGWIGYGDWSPGKSINKRYTVFSSYIENGRYKETHGAFRTAGSTSLIKAVKLAKTYLRPAPLKDVAAQALPALSASLRAAYEGVTKEVKEAVATLAPSMYVSTALPPDLEYELRKLHADGYKFSTGAFNTALEKYISYKDQYDAAVAFPYRVYYVQPHVLAGTPQIHTVAVNVSRGQIYMPSFLAGNVMYLDEPEQEAVYDKLAVLNMMTTAEYVPGVGMRLDAARYFVVV